MNPAQNQQIQLPKRNFGISIDRPGHISHLTPVFSSTVWRRHYLSNGSNPSRKKKKRMKRSKESYVTRDGKGIA